MDATERLLGEVGIRALFLVWGAPQGSHRSQFMAQDMGMEIEHVYLTPRQGALYALLKYPVQAVETLAVLARQRPQVVFVQNPPIFAALMVYLWGLRTGTKYIVDSHTDALLSSWWTWSLPLHRFLSRRAITTLVTNEHLRQMVAAWGANTFTLRDPPTTFPRRRPIHLDNNSFNVVVVSTASYDEPISQILEAARNLPEVGFYITGNYRAKAPHIIQRAPANVHFTGYVPDEEFYGLLEAAQVVMCLTTENHTMQSGASEALWLGKPIITSDWPILQAYFNKGTIHTDNTGPDICRAVQEMKDNLANFEADIRSLQKDRRREWCEKANGLTLIIQEAM
jgi:glycosyltransferase involved in cell wall biosynthesis